MKSALYEHFIFRAPGVPMLASLYVFMREIVQYLATAFFVPWFWSAARWGCALPLGTPVPPLGGVCALSAVGATVASLPCLGQCALTRPRIPGGSKLPRDGRDVAAVQNSNIGLLACPGVCLQVQNHGLKRTCLVLSWCFVFNYPAAHQPVVSAKLCGFAREIHA